MDPTSKNPVQVGRSAARDKSGERPESILSKGKLKGLKPEAFINFIKIFQLVKLPVERPRAIAFQGGVRPDLASRQIKAEGHENRTRLPLFSVFL
jgi:hypothetical protein